MRAVIKLEFIGENYYACPKDKKRYRQKYEKAFGRDKSRPWVARITGLCKKYGFKREFIRGQRDYSQANSVGSRGIFCYYPLKSGIYEVNERLSWKKVRRYFIKVEEMDFQEISKDEAIEWLIKNI